MPVPFCSRDQTPGMKKSCRYGVAEGDSSRQSEKREPKSRFIVSVPGIEGPAQTVLGMRFPRRIQTADAIGRNRIPPIVPFCSCTRRPRFPQMLEKNGGDDETRTRDLCRDRAAF